MTIHPTQPRNTYLDPEGEEHTNTKDQKGSKRQTKKERYLQAVMELTKAFTLSVPVEEAIHIRDDVNFFQTVKAAILKKAPSEQRTAGRPGFQPSNR